MRLPLTNGCMGREVGHLLGEISKDEVRRGQAILRALGVKTEPRPHSLASRGELDKLSTDTDEMECRELDKEQTYRVWRRPPPRRVVKEQPSSIHGNQPGAEA